MIDPQLDPPVFVNVPDRFVRLGRGAWWEALEALVAARELCWWLTKRDVIGRYRQSLIGIGWAVLTPLALVAVFVFLHASQLVEVGETSVAYPVFIYLGLLPWQLLHACLTRSTSCLISSAELVKRVRFPREILVLSALSGALFDFLVGALLLVGVCAWYQPPLAWTIVFVPLLILLELTLALSLGLVLAVLNAATRDVGSIVPMAALLWMFITPVVYPPAREGSAALVNWLNPMSAILTGVRDLTLRGELTMAGPLGLWALVAVLLLPLAWRFFHVALPRVAETI